MIAKLVASKSLIGAKVYFVPGRNWLAINFVEEALERFPPISRIF